MKRRRAQALIGHSENKDPIWTALMAAVWEQAMRDLARANLPVQMEALDFLTGEKGGMYMDAFGWEDPETPYVMLARLKHAVRGLGSGRPASSDKETTMKNHINMLTLFDGLSPDEAKELSKRLIAAAGHLRGEILARRRPAAKVKGAPPPLHPSSRPRVDG